MLGGAWNRGDWNRGAWDNARGEQWLAFAREATVKRMRDEARAWTTTRAYRRADAEPGDDAAWQESLRREPGRARSRVVTFGNAIAGALEASRPSAAILPDVFLRWQLPFRVASDFVAAIESARRRVQREADTVAWDAPWPPPDTGEPPASLKAARHYVVRCRRVPSWVGLLVLLEDFVTTWDVGRGFASDAVYIRDGWRCTAPGCSSRRNLEDHHIVYRSRGGSDHLDNRTCLCRYHHQRGEHGGLMTCRGTAPLGPTWRMGRDGTGGTFHNERRESYEA